MEDFDWELSRKAALAAVEVLRSSGATARDNGIEAVARALEDAATIKIEDEAWSGSVGAELDRIDPRCRA